jgi:hypothetical protein
MLLVELHLLVNRSQLAGAVIEPADVMNITVAFLTYRMAFLVLLQALVLVLEITLFVADMVL